MSRIVYVAGPYSGKSKFWLLNRIQRFINILRAYRVAKKLWRSGVTTICPHINTFWMDGVNTKDIFINGNLETLERCDYILLLNGWIKSKGSIGEKVFAERKLIPIYYENKLDDLITKCSGD